MSKRLEVRAALSFGVFRAGRVYEVDIEDDRIMSLLGVGYLEPTSDPEVDDELGSTAGLDSTGSTGGSGVRDVRVVGSPQSSKGVTDVARRPGQIRDSQLGTSARVRGRKATGSENVGGGSDSGEDGNSQARIGQAGSGADSEGEPSIS